MDGRDNPAMTRNKWFNMTVTRYGAADILSMISNVEPFVCALRRCISKAH